MTVPRCRRIGICFWPPGGTGERGAVGPEETGEKIIAAGLLVNGTSGQEKSE
jgi:hypothetical protein